MWNNIQITEILFLKKTKENFLNKQIKEFSA